MAGNHGQKHAFLVAGSHSGCGKTTVTLGLLAAFRARGIGVQPFKVGPDFIDPGLHTQIAGVESRNLDGWMLSRAWNVGLFRRLMAKADLALVEGVMGLYDGYEGGSESGSSAEMAKWLGIPAILVVDARSMARSAAALVYGFTRFDPDLNVCGVVFNRIGGSAHLEYLKDAVGSSLPGVTVLGGIPREDLVRIPERHLGLVTADEMKLDKRWQEELARLVEKNLDLDLLLEKTRYTDDFEHSETNGRKSGTGDQTAVSDLRPPTSDIRSVSVLRHPTSDIRHPSSDLRPVIAVARDAAFCFYYPDNLELLEAAGARLHFFSPVSGENLPGACSGLYLGGGYPELFAGAIAQNTAFLESVRERAREGMPVYAECGGLMTLGRFIDTIEGERFSMAGVLPFGTRMLERRKALGYTEVVLRRECLLGEPGRSIRGHEFHYSEIAEFAENTELDLAYELHKRKHEPARSEGYQRGSVLASYIHLHWGSAPEAAYHFVSRCAAWNNRR